MYVSYISKTRDIDIYDVVLASHTDITNNGVENVTSNSTRTQLTECLKSSGCYFIFLLCLIR